MCINHIFVQYVGKVDENYVPLRTRNTIFVRDANGNLLKYQRTKETTPRKSTPTKLTPRKSTRGSKTKPNSVSKAKPKSVLKTKPKSVSKAEEVAQKMKQCVVPLERLSEHRMNEIQEWVKRQHDLRAVKGKLPSLSCKKF